MTSTADSGGRYRSCLYWDGHSYQLACPDDLCHGSGQTLCGLEHGYDFDVQDDEWDEGWSDDEDSDPAPNGNDEMTDQYRPQTDEDWL